MIPLTMLVVFEVPLNGPPPEERDRGLVMEEKLVILTIKEY